MFWKRTEKVTKASYDTMVERYEASIKSKDDTIGRVCTERDNARKTSEDMLARNLELQAVSKGILRDKIAESERANLAEQRVNSLLDEIAALRPDTEKHREKLRRDREHAENTRVRKRAMKAAA